MLTEKVLEVNHWSDRIFSFKTTRSESFRFNSGEFAMIGQMIADKKIIRAYSVVSPPWADHLEFLSIKNVGLLTNELANIKEDDELILLPKCTGTLRNTFLTEGGKRLVLLATGTGLAPFMSTIRDIDLIEAYEEIHLVHSVRDRDDLAYWYELLSVFEDEPDLHELLKDKFEYTDKSNKIIANRLDSNRDFTDLVTGNLTGSINITEQ